MKRHEVELIEKRLAANPKKGAVFYRNGREIEPMRFPRQGSFVGVKGL